MKQAIAICALALGFAAPVFAQEVGVASETLFTSESTASGMSLEAVAEPKVLVTKVTIAPGASLPVHRHPHQRYAYVLLGRVIVNAPETGAEYPYRAGDFIAELRGEWHAGTNPGETPAVLLVIDQIPREVTGNTELRAE